jgi:hypothetical protein
MRSSRKHARSEESRGNEVQRKQQDKVDSAADKYGKYKKYFETKPIIEPKYDAPILYEPKDRIGKAWFVDPNDINVGQAKLKKSE